MKYFLHTIIILSFLFIGLTSHSQFLESDEELSRIPPATVLERAQEAFEALDDLQTTFYQLVQHQNGRVEELWAQLKLINQKQDEQTQVSMMSLQLYEDPLPEMQRSDDNIQDSTAPEPVKIYFADPNGKLYTYEPKMNTLTIEWLDERGPLPEFMQLAGFLEFDIEELKKKVYLHKDVYRQTVNDISCYRVRITPRGSMKDVEPDRILWISRETNFPMRLTIEGDTVVTVQFDQHILNQGISIEDVVPEVPQNATINNLTKTSAQSN